MTAPVQIDSASNAAGATSIPVTQTANPTIGNTNMVWVALDAGTTVSNVQDTLGHTYTSRGSVTEVGTFQILHQFTAPITATGANTVTANYTASATGRRIAVVEGAGTYDASNTGTDTGSNPTPAVSATNSAQPATVHALCNDVQGGLPGVGTGFTNTGTGWAGSTQFRAQYDEVLSVGSQSATFANSTINRNNTGVIILLDFPPPPSGPTIDAQPSSAWGRTGATSAPITAAATTSGGAMTAQWYDDSSGSFAAISGETNVTTFNPGTITAAMKYRRYYVIWTDSNGSTQSRTIYLTPTYPIKFPQTELPKNRRGASDLWDVDPAGVVLKDDWFPAAVSSPSSAVGGVNPLYQLGRY